MTLVTVSLDTVIFRSLPFLAVCCLIWFVVKMLSKESLSLIAQNIYDDLLLAFEAQGVLKKYVQFSVSESHLLNCRVPIRSQ